MINCPETLNVGDHITIEGVEATLEGVVRKFCDDLSGYIHIIEDETGDKLRVRGDLGRIIEWQGMDVS